MLAAPACIVCEVLVHLPDDNYGYIVEEAAFDLDDVVCLACADQYDWQRCECCQDLTPIVERGENQWGQEVCEFCLHDCRASRGCQVTDDRQRRADVAQHKASELSEVRDMLKGSLQWVARNKRPSEL